jgi:hypothetical protein
MSTIGRVDGGLPGIHGSTVRVNGRRGIVAAGAADACEPTTTADVRSATRPRTRSRRERAGMVVTPSNAPGVARVRSMVATAVAL